MHLSVVVPAYNEQSKITADLQEALRFLDSTGVEAELIVVDDGSTDKTAETIRNFARSRPSGASEIRCLSYSQNRGKGHAVRYGILRARGQFVAFVDSGLCVPFEQLQRGLKPLGLQCDCAIASRRLQETKIVVAQPKYRQIGSKVFSWVVRSLMGVQFVSDTQCGFKLYTSEAAQEIFSRVRTDGFMFDVEALLIAKRLGYQVQEFPVDWSNDADSRYDPIWGTLRNLNELARIRLRSFVPLSLIKPLKLQPQGNKTS